MTEINRQLNNLTYSFNTLELFCVFRFGSEAAEVRALVEGQVMAKRIHAQNMGFNISQYQPHIPGLWIRIRLGPHSCSLLDPDPHSIGEGFFGGFFNS